jgi:hypothetical protein
MANYQLSKTNVFLGGQLKWNLQIESRKDELFIHDFFLSPISKWVNFSRPDDRVFNYTHEENLVRFYKSIQSNFFEPVTDPKLQIKTPIVTDDLEYENTYCDEYDMGLSRASVTTLGKSLQILCPLWLEDFNETNELSFNINIYTKEKTNEIVRDSDGNPMKDIYGNYIFEEVYKNNTIVIKTLKLTLSGQDVHDDFVNYFNSYIKNIIDVDNGVVGDKVIDIDFKNSKMIAEGINLNTGKLTSKNVSYILPNLSSRFRPMMDTDNIIIGSFYNNEMICKQLFNFNLIFNIEDILLPGIINQIKGQKIYFDITTRIDNQDLLIKSFSYDYGEKFKIGNSKEGINTLSFFEDYNYIGLIDKNKITQNIIHWSLNKDNDYIFNLYPNANYNTNIWSENAEYDPNCLNWCNNDILYGVDGEYDNVKEYKLLTKIMNSEYSCFDTGNIYVNNIFYNNKNSEKIYLYINIVNNLIEDNRLGQYVDRAIPIYEKPFDTNSIYGYIYSFNALYHNIIIDKKHTNKITYKYITSRSTYGTDKNTLDDALYRYSTSYIILSLNGFRFERIFKNTHEPIILPFNNSIIKIPQDINDKQYSIKEINYKKVLNPNIYLFRYDGLIKPTFVDYKNNVDYVIKKITTDEYNNDPKNIGWKKLLKKGVPVIYPSINYFYINEKENITDSFIYDKKIETHHYNDSFVYILMNEINVNIVQDKEKDPRSIKENIKNLINYYYNIVDKDVSNFIYNLYDCEIYFDYVDNNINVYNYNIKLKLK